MNQELEQYILDHCEPEPEVLRRLYRHTYLHHLYPHQCSGHLQGRVLSMLSKMIRPRRILELGTYTGYSALCLAEGLYTGGELHTVDRRDEDADELRELFEANDPRITFHVGDAADIIAELPAPWDLVFIDADKRQYCRYLDLVIPRMAKGGFILVDNTLWGGKITDEDERDAQTEGVRKFNDLVASRAAELTPVILPLRDGLTILQVKQPNGTEND